MIRDGVPEDVAHLETLEAPDFAERIPEPVPPEHEGFGTHDEWAVQTKQWFEDLRRERGEINGR